MPERLRPGDLFQSAPPHGRRLLPACVLAMRPRVSIRASAREATCGRQVFRGRHGVVSIRASAREATQDY